MGTRKTPSRYKLGKILDGELADLSAGYKDAPMTGLVREAVKEYIIRCLENEPEVKKRYEIARKKRLGLADKVVQLVDKNND